MATEESIEEITLRLAAILDALASIPPGPSPRRFELLTEQDELREQAAKFAADRDVGRSATELEAELESLRRHRAETVESRTGYVTSKGGGQQAPTGGAWVGAEARALSAGGIDQMNARISQIEDVLRERAEEDE